MKVSYQGATGAFSEMAARVMYANSEPVACPTMQSVFRHVTTGRAARGVIPIENSLFGSVHINYDLLLKHRVRITGELMLRVRHCLLAAPGTSLADVTRVLSHPQALGQCEDFLRRTLPHAQTVPSYDTAGAAKLVASASVPGAAAIAARHAAAEYGLAVLAENIESHDQNFTRFLALARPTAANLQQIGDRPFKTSLAFDLKRNVPGALFKSLAVFALRDLDLHKIESRPLVGSPGHYLFYLDVAGRVTTPLLQRALDHLQEITGKLRVLGSYPVGAVWDRYPATK